MEFRGSGSEILVECLVNAGIATIFGVPGDTGIGFYDALFRRSDDIRHVLAADERSSASMADVYARVRNRVGVVEASSGGGSTYLVGGLGEPYAASVPMLVITSDIHRSSQGTSAITEVDQVKLFSAVTKAQFYVDDTVKIPTVVQQALYIATSGRPGPVSLIFPEDVLDEVATVEIPRFTPEDSSVPRRRSGVAYDQARTAGEKLAQAFQPAIVVGSGIHTSEAWTVLEEMADRHGIPVATTIHGKGSLRDTSDWSLGVIGANGARDYANAYVAQADVVLMVGTRANSTDTNGFTVPPRTVTVIHVDVDEQRAGRNYPDAMRLVGDARTILEEILDGMPKGPSDRRDRIRAWIRERRAVWIQAPLETVPEGTLHPRLVVEAIQAELGDAAVVVADAGTPTPYLSAFWEKAQAGRTVVIPRGHGAMGFAIPGAIGAQLAQREQTVVGLTTDGSFAMACGELATAARLKLPIIYVHLRNGALGWIKMLQHLYLGQRFFGVDLSPANAVLVATGMGLAAEEVTTLDGLKQALRRAQGRSGPTLIDVPVPEERDLVPPVAPWQATLAGTGGRPVY